MAAPISDQSARSNNYYALLEEGDKNLQQGLYKEAKVVFENAHNMRPNDAIPVQRLEEIRLKTNNKETLAEVELNEKYILLTATAKTNLDQKQYKEAQDKYKQALLLKPNDLYVNHQLEKIDLLLKEEMEKKERLKLQELYRTYISDGEKALKQNKLAEARISFEQALVITPNDPLAKTRIAAIDSKEKELSRNETSESDYNALINDADKAFQAGDYTTGKALYNKALALTKQPWPKDQISHINKLEADRAAKETADKLALQQKEAIDKEAREDQALENSYYATVQTADKLYKDGRLEEAKASYNKALQIINKPWPKQQIAKINTLIAEQDLKDKTEKQKLAIKLERERRESEALALENKYNVAVKTADDLFKSGKYTEAKTAYIAAMGIISKPWPEEQLKKINKKEDDIAAAEKAENLRNCPQRDVDEKIQYCYSVRRYGSSIKKTTSKRKSFIWMRL
jgi:tetratricopeptide (TPR) repeat protein